MRPRDGLAAIVAVAALLAACGGDDATSATTTPGPATTAAATTPIETTTPIGTMPPAGHDTDHAMDPTERAAAMLATAGFQDVETAEAAGYASSLDTLGCFEDPDRGGMGVHFILESLMDDAVDITTPEALVYELDAKGNIAGLVAHEYIVPIDAWSSSEPPSLFGMEFHQDPTLPLWVLHTWLWKDNPAGVFQDWNPAVRQCPAGVPIFGKDLPEPEPEPDPEATPLPAVDETSGSKPVTSSAVAPPREGYGPR